jgi:hypothetical protein
MSFFVVLSGGRTTKNLRDPSPSLQKDEYVDERSLLGTGQERSNVQWPRVKRDVYRSHFVAGEKRARY